MWAAWHVHHSLLRSITCRLNERVCVSGDVRRMRAQAEAAVLARLTLDSKAGGAPAAAPDLAAAGSAADQAAVAAALLAVSGDGRWAAVASGRNVHLVNLARLQCHGILPPLQARPPRRGLRALQEILCECSQAAPASFGLCSFAWCVRCVDSSWTAGVLAVADKGSYLCV